MNDLEKLAFEHSLRRQKVALAAQFQRARAKWLKQYGRRRQQAGARRLPGGSRLPARRSTIKRERRFI